MRAAVVGTGFIGVVHVEALRRLGVEVTGVVGSSPERAREKAKTAVLPEPYESFEAMLADDRVDVVHLTSPNKHHHAQAKAALEAGKHVGCEKPLAMDSRETAELLALAEASGLVHAVNFNIRFYPQVIEARERVAGLGPVHLVTGGYLQDWLLFETDWNWRLDPAEGGALRAVGDIGSHWIDLLSFITGQPIVSVMADLATFVTTREEPTGPVETFSTDRSAQTVTRPMGTEDAATLLVRFANGARGCMAVSQISAGRKNSLRWEVDGADGAAAWDSETPEHLWLGHRDRPNELLLRNPALMGEAGRAAAALPGGHVEGFGDTFGALFRAIYADVLAGRPRANPPYADFAAGHDEMLVNDAIARSAAEERWVDVERAPTTEAARPALSEAAR